MANRNGQPRKRRPREAITDQIRAHEAWLRTVLASRVGDPFVVDDLIQEMYLQILRKPEAVARVERLEPWLYRVAVRLALQHRRQAGRRRRHLENLKHASAMETGTEQDPAHWLASQEAHGLVRQAMAELGSVDRELLTLKHAHGWTYQQMSDHLGVTISTIEYRLMRARRRLRQLVSSHNFAETHS